MKLLRESGAMSCVGTPTLSPVIYIQHFARLVIHSVIRCLRTAPGGGEKRNDEGEDVLLEISVHPLNQQKA